MATLCFQLHDGSVGNLSEADCSTYIGTTIRNSGMKTDGSCSVETTALESRAFWLFSCHFFLMAKLCPNESSLIRMSPNEWNGISCLAANMMTAWVIPGWN